MAVTADYPFRFESSGRVANATPDDHVRDLIYQVLFTSPGERVNRPDFGCGLRQLVFMPNSDALATATQFVVQGSLERWLSDIIQVQFVRIQSREETITVEVGYIRKDTGERIEDSFTL
ncbi:MAG: GPW/gp25 family protein [Bryobacteraceae bacterium]|nr:GPW/gp25 family protein [Bryobacteraceae bacterium]